MISRAALATLAALAFCATPAVAAPTAITEFPARPKSMYIDASAPTNSLWYTIQGVGVQQISTDGEDLASNLSNPAAADLAVDADGSVTWTANPPVADPLHGGWVRRNFTGSITKTKAAQSENANAIILPSPGAPPLITGHFPTGNDCVYSAATCVATLQGNNPTATLTGLAVDGAGRVWAFSPELNLAIRVSAAGNINPDLSVTMAPGTAPRRGARGPDGSLWVAGSGGRIVKITPQGVQTSFTLPPGRGPNDITLGPDGALWFTESVGNAIGRITTDGRYRSFPVPSPASKPFGITMGPDRNIWFTEFDGGRIGKLVPGDDLNEGTRPLPAAKDTKRPAMGSIRLSRTRFRAARSGASISQRRRKRRKAPVGTRVRFSMSEAAAVRFTVERKTAGRRVKKKCVAPKRSNRKRKRCTRYVAVTGSFTVKGTPGTNSFVFRGRIGRRSLKSGSYRLTGRATDPSKNISLPRRKAFKIVK